MRRPSIWFWVSAPYEPDGYTVADFMDGTGHYSFPRAVRGIEAHHSLGQGKNNTAANLDLCPYIPFDDDPVCSI